MTFELVEGSVKVACSHSLDPEEKAKDVDR